MGSWTTIKITTNNPENLFNTIKAYADTPTDPYCEASRDWEMTATFCEGVLALTGNEEFQGVDFETLIPKIYEEPFKINRRETKSAVEILCNN
jgi:hypothetical protein